MAAKKGKNKHKDAPSAVNKKAYRNFELVEKFEAGLELLGSEVKSLRAGQGDLDGSYARILDEQCWLVGATIAPYEQAGDNNHHPTRKRKLLLHKRKFPLITGSDYLMYRFLYFSPEDLSHFSSILGKGIMGESSFSGHVIFDKEREFPFPSRLFLSNIAVVEILNLGVI